MKGGELGAFAFTDCYFEGSIYMSSGAAIGNDAFHCFQDSNFSLFINSDSTSFGSRAFYNSSLISITNSDKYTISSIGSEAFANCIFLSCGLEISADHVGYGNIDDVSSITCTNILKGAPGFTSLHIYGKNEGNEIADFAFSGLNFSEGIIEIDEKINEIGRFTFSGCIFYRIDLSKCPSGLKINQLMKNILSNANINNLPCFFKYTYHQLPFS